MKKILKITGIYLLCTLILLSEVNAKSKNKKQSKNQTVVEQTLPNIEEPVQKEEPKPLRKGEGVVIAITQPVLRSAETKASWMPQFFQDSLTGNFAKYSKMTVLDRTNESLAKAEIRMSEESFYDEENTVEIGHMTNARFVLFGTIQKISSEYELNFRVNDIETNEIRAAFNGRYNEKDIESGKAVCDIVQGIFEGLEIDLTDKEKSSLSVIGTKDIKGTASLAKGAAAEKSDNIIEALMFYREAEESGATREEAGIGIKNVLGSNTLSETGIQNIRAQLDYANKQIENWSKIFTEISDYIKNNLYLLVYDFSKTEMNISDNLKEVDFKFSPGIKQIPNRQVLLVAKTIVDEWNKILNDDSNKSWVSKVKNAPRYPSNIGLIRRDMKDICYIPSNGIYVTIGFYDDSNYEIQNSRYTRGSYDLIGTGLIYLDNIKPQKLYFSESEFKDGKAKLDMNKVPEEGDVTFKVKGIEKSYTGIEKGIPPKIMSIEEYTEWAKDK